jgi:excisionase family DNA binding protein
MSSDILPRLLTTKDLAKRLRCSPWHIRQLVKAGILPTVKLGRKLLFSPTAVAIALQERESTAMSRHQEA